MVRSRYHRLLILLTQMAVPVIVEAVVCGGFVNIISPIVGTIVGDLASSPFNKVYVMLLSASLARLWAVATLHSSIF